MADLQLTEEQRMIRDMARDFAEKEIAPIAAEMDERGEIPMELIRKMARLGFMGLSVPEEYGGSGLDTLTYVLVAEEISRVCASSGTIMGVASLAGQGILLHGTEEQKQKFLRPLATGEKLGAFALTEPEAGSDVAAITTRAERDGDSYVINGTKHFITNGGLADIVVVIAVTDRSKGARGFSAFIVEKGTPGFTYGKKENKMGIRASNTQELIFEDCRVPAENLIGGREGMGFRIAMDALDAGRIGVAAQAVGIAQGAYEQALSYAKTRRQFGEPIANFQGIRWMLADMATRIEAARLLVWKAALAKDATAGTRKRYTLEAAMAKLYATETASYVVDLALQIHGGYGYMKEYPIERMYRDVRITRIYEGTSEIQREVIGHHILR